MEFEQLVRRAMEVRRKFVTFEERRYGRSWTNEELALGFVVDVGDLMRLVMARNGVRDIPNVQSKLAHELADCLWSVMVLSQLCDVDLEQAFLRTMDELEQWLTKQAAI